MAADARVVADLAHRCWCLSTKAYEFVRNKTQWGHFWACACAYSKTIQRNRIMHNKSQRNQDCDIKWHFRLIKEKEQYLTVFDRWDQSAGCQFLRRPSIGKHGHVFADCSTVSSIHAKHYWHEDCCLRYQFVGRCYGCWPVYIHRHVGLIYHNVYATNSVRTTTASGLAHAHIQSIDISVHTQAFSHELIYCISGSQSVSACVYLSVCLCTCRCVGSCVRVRGFSTCKCIRFLLKYAVNSMFWKHAQKKCLEVSNGRKSTEQRKFKILFWWSWGNTWRERKKCVQ